MWILTQDKKDMVNVDNLFSVCMVNDEIRAIPLLFDSLEHDFVYTCLGKYKENQIEKVYEHLCEAISLKKFEQYDMPMDGEDNEAK